MRLFPSRKYKSGTGWCLWRWTDVPTEYIVRLHLLKTPWFSICIHWLNKADPDSNQHDHPVSFLSLLWSGWYIEKRKDDVFLRTWFNYIKYTDAHTITAVGRNTVTVCFMGPKRQEWGFYTDKGRVYWKDYYKVV